jgi:hypothetical protein
MEKRRYPGRQTTFPEKEKIAVQELASPKKVALIIFVNAVLFSWGVVPIMVGMDHAMPLYNYPYRGMEPRCLSEPRRIETFVPAYRLGCWLGGEKGKPYYGPAKEEAWQTPRK